MRIIERAMTKAFKEGRPLKRGDDEVQIKSMMITEEAYYRLHGNLIAVRVGSTLHLRDAGDHTSTTKSRLNALATVYGLPHLFQKAFDWYWTDGQDFTGSRIFDLNQF